MDRNELVRRFARYMTTHRMEWKGQNILVNFLYGWFKFQVKSDHEYDSILGHLHEYLGQAMEHFRTTVRDENLPENMVDVGTMREAYLHEVGMDVFPVLTDVSAGLDRTLLISHLARMMAEITGWDGAEAKIDGYFRAEDNVLDHSLQRFNRQVWQKGMWQMIRDSHASGMSGQFDETELGTFYTAGRVMLTFSRPSLADNQKSVSFVADYSDAVGVRTGVQSVYAKLHEAVSMIDEVANGWPMTPEEQYQAFQANRTIGII